MPREQDARRGSPPRRPNRRGSPMTSIKISPGRPLTYRAPGRALGAAKAARCWPAAARFPASGRKGGEPFLVPPRPRASLVNFRSRNAENKSGRLSRCGAADLALRGGARGRGGTRIKQAPSAEIRMRESYLRPRWPPPGRPNPGPRGGRCSSARRDVARDTRTRTHAGPRTGRPVPRTPPCGRALRAPRGHGRVTRPLGCTVCAMCREQGGAMLLSPTGRKPRSDRRQLWPEHKLFRQRQIRRPFS